MSRKEASIREEKIYSRKVTRKVDNSNKKIRSLRDHRKGAE